VRRKQKGLKLNGTHQLLVYANDGTVLDQTINMTNARKKISLEGHAEKTKYTLISRQPPAEQSREVKIVNPLKMWRSSDV
jgi:hypothetical protein